MKWTLDKGAAIDTDFPGGNVLVEGIDSDTIRLQPDLRDTDGWWFYWCFRVTGAPGRTLRFEFTGNNPIGVRGPAVSVDGGGSWRWLGAAAVEDNAFVYAVPGDCREARFGFAMPYQPADFERFLNRFEGHAGLSREVLCLTGRPDETERIHLGRIRGGAARRILVACRHHCCETMASYALEGLIETALGDDETGRWFRECAEVVAVPFVDKAGAMRGDQGKNRRPYDHNRDYGGESIYPSCAAIRRFVPAWLEGARLDAALDLHCPHIRGAHNECIYLVGSRHERQWAEQGRFGEILEGEAVGPLPYRAEDNLAFGQGWNTGENRGSLRTFASWACEDAGARLATTIEIPYANARGAEVTAGSARALGRDLAVALRRYLG